MDASEVIEVCRLCPATGASQVLLCVFDDRYSVKNNMKEVILVTTGIEILENDLVSKKVCQRCCNITLKMLEFRQDALKQDRALKEKCSSLLGDRGIRLPNTCITIKQEKRELFLLNKQLKVETIVQQSPSTSRSVAEPSPSTSRPELRDMLHPSITQLYQSFPHLKLPKTCVDRHMAPVVALPMGDVEKYFKARKLDMKHFVYKSRTSTLGKGSSNKIAKKRTSGVQKKTVAPLKISKKLFGLNKQQSTNTGDSYVCTPIHKHKSGRKRSVSLSDTEKKLKAKIFKKTGSTKAPDMSLEHAYSSDESTGANDVPLPATPSPPSSPLPSRPPSPIHEEPEAQVTSARAETPSIAETPAIATVPVIATRPIKAATSVRAATPVRATTPTRCATPARVATMVVEESEESRESAATNISVETSSSGSKPDFLESFGLTPTVTTTKSHTMLVCNLCGSVHNNAFELKRHTIKHMVCQFCKRRFKSLEAKQDHIDNTCEIKKIMNYDGPIVSLEYTHLNLGIRKKYEKAFSSFDPIPGLHSPAPVEEVIVRAVSPPLPIDNIIVLSDDDDSEITSADPLSGVPTPADEMPSPALEAVVYNTVALVRPDVRIKHNAILNDLPANMCDKQLVKDLIKLIKPKKDTVEKMLQTDLPANKDIKINNLEGTCEFKNLKDQLLTYKVPITVSCGSFHVAYQFKNKPKPNNKAAHWKTIPLLDVKNKRNGKKKPSHVPVIVAASQQQPAVQVSTNPPVNNPAQRLISPPSTTLPQQPVIQTSTNSATPLLQNYALSMTPATTVVIAPKPIPKSFVNSAINNRNMAQLSSNTAHLRNSSSNYTNAVPSTSSSNVNTSSSNGNTSSSNVHSINISPAPVVNSMVLQQGSYMVQPNYVLNDNLANMLPPTMSLIAPSTVPTVTLPTMTRVSPPSMPPRIPPPPPMTRVSLPTMTRFPPPTMSRVPPPPTMTRVPPPPTMTRVSTPFMTRNTPPTRPNVPTSTNNAQPPPSTNNAQPPPSTNNAQPPLSTNNAQPPRNNTPAPASAEVAKFRVKHVSELR